ncbi:MAG: hypothetical protein ABR591_10385 [Candidatus Velthaea sp.]
MSVTNVTPRPATAGPNQRTVLIVILIALVAIFLLRGCFFHENQYEKLARDVTVALQRNDVEAVKKYQNAETATHVNRGIVGRAADRLGPLGNLKSVKETTPSGAPDRQHEFDVAFDRGRLHESMKVDPEGKIVSFRYEPVAAK